MTSKPVYQLSARQLILLALSTALIAVAASLLLFKLSSLWETTGGPGISFAETAPVAELIEQFGRSDRAGEDYQQVLDCVRRRVNERRFALGVQLIVAHRDPIEVAEG